MRWSSDRLWPALAKIRRIAVAEETTVDEGRVALVPDVAARLATGEASFRMRHLTGSYYTWEVSTKPTWLR
jgi:hypothetical protein